MTVEIEMTAKRWLALLLITAILVMSAAAVRPVLSISPPDPASQVAEQPASQRAPQSSRIGIVPR